MLICQRERNIENRHLLSLFLGRFEYCKTLQDANQTGSAREPKAMKN